MKRRFFQTAVVSKLLYGCTTWTLTKRLEKKLDGNYTRMLRAILNKSWRQHPTRHQLYGHLPPITKTIQVRRTRHAGHCWGSKDELISDVLLWTLAYGQVKAGRPARTYIQQLCEDTDVALKTCQRRWTIGGSGEKGSVISVQAVRHDDYDLIHRWDPIRVGQDGPESNGNQGLLHFSQISRTGSSPSEGLVSYPGHTLVEVLPALQWCSQRIQGIVNNVTDADTLNVWIYNNSPKQFVTKYSNGNVQTNLFEKQKKKKKKEKRKQ